MEISVQSSLKRVLEVGPGLNPICQDLSPDWEVTMLEPIEYFFQDLRNRFSKNPRVNCLNSLLEDVNRLSDLREFDLVLMSSVMHELTDVDKALKNLLDLLAPEGKLIVIVPNKEYLHRMESLNLSQERGLSETEIKMQQSMSFSPSSLVEFLQIRGFETLKVLTSFVKPYHHAKMQELIERGALTLDSLDQLYEISSTFNPYCAEIFWVGARL